MHSVAAAADGQRAYAIGAQWYLRPAELPTMRERAVAVGRARHVQALASTDTSAVVVRASEHLAAEAPAWDALLAGRSPLSVPARTRHQVIVNLDTYLTAFAKLTTSDGAGAYVRVSWTESLFLTAGTQSAARGGPTRRCGGTPAVISRSPSRPPTNR